MIRLCCRTFEVYDCKVIAAVSISNLIPLCRNVMRLYRQNVSKYEEGYVRKLSKISTIMFRFALLIGIRCLLDIIINPPSFRLYFSI